MSDSRKMQEQEIDRLYHEVENYRSAEHYRDLLDFICKFPRIAPYNAMLLHIQKPGSFYVGDVRFWESLGRRPKAEARPLIILKPFGPVSFVYELNDTEGAPVPEEVWDSFRARGYVTNRDLEILIENLRREGIGYSEGDYGTEAAGKITRPEKILEDFCFKAATPRGKDKFVPHEYDIVVNRRHDTATKMATIFHELGHYFSGHLGGYPENPNVAGRPYETLSEGTKEFEAETISYLVCKRLGIKSSAASYLGEYFEWHQEIPEDISVDTVLKATGKIEKMLQPGYPCRERNK